MFSKLPPWLITTLKFLLTAVVLILVGREFSKSWDGFVSYDWKIDWTLAVTSIVAQLTTLVGMSLVWCWLIAGLGHPVSLAHGFKIAYISNLGRYLPGRIWQVVSMIHFTDRLGIPKIVSVASWGIATFLGFPAACLGSVVAVYLEPRVISPEKWAVIGPPMLIGTISTLAIVALFVIRPTVLTSVYNFIVSRFGREPISLTLRRGVAAKVFVGYLLAWLLYGFSFWIFVRALVPSADIPVLPVVGAFILAYQIGYLAIFSPGGLGTRELVLSTALAPFVGPLAPGIAIAGRLWSIVAELLVTAIAFRLSFPDQVSQKPQEKAAP